MMLAMGRLFTYNIYSEFQALIPLNIGINVMANVKTIGKHACWF